MIGDIRMGSTVRGVGERRHLAEESVRFTMPRRQCRKIGAPDFTKSWKECALLRMQLCVHRDFPNLVVHGRVGRREYACLFPYDTTLCVCCFRSWIGELGAGRALIIKLDRP